MSQSAPTATYHLSSICQFEEERRESTPASYPERSSNNGNDE